MGRHSNGGSDIERVIRVLLLISSGEWTRKAIAERENCHPDTISNAFEHLKACGIEVTCSGYPDYMYSATRGGDWWVKSIPKDDLLAIRREVRIEKIATETDAEREVRLAKDRDYQRRYYPRLKQRGGTETPEQRAARLERNRESVKNMVNSMDKTYINKNPLTPYRDLLPYEKVKKWVRENLVPIGINTYRKFLDYKKGLYPKSPKYPKNLAWPSNYQEFEGWSKFFDRGKRARGRALVREDWPEYEAFIKILKNAGITKGIEYKDFQKKSTIRLPSTPGVYKEWKGWKHFFKS